MRAIRVYDAVCLVAVSLAAPTVDEPICCACSKGSDMGSDLWIFSHAASHGQGCGSCCAQQTAKGYNAGKRESIFTCMNHTYGSAECKEQVQADVAQTYHVYRSTTTLDNLDSVCYQLDSRLKDIAAVALELEAAIEGLNILWPIQGRNTSAVAPGACVCGCGSTGCAAQTGYAHACERTCATDSTTVLGLNLTTVQVCHQDQS